MENKLPKVGTRYRRIKPVRGSILNEIEVSEGGTLCWVNHTKGTMLLAHFLREYEELPMETTEKDWHVPKIDMNKFQIGIEKAGKWIKCPYMPATPEFNKWFKEEFNCCPVTGKPIEDHKEEEKPICSHSEIEKNGKCKTCEGWVFSIREEISAVDKALERLKESKSIWKDVSELPEKLKEVLFKKNDEEICFGWIHPFDFPRFRRLDNFEIPKSQVKKYCTLTDFINNYESEKKARIELEGRAERIEQLLCRFGLVGITGAKIKEVLKY